MNYTEVFIKRFYHSVHIRDPFGLTIDNVTEKINLCVHFWEFGSAITEYNGKRKMFINENLNVRQQWQEFGHEMSHYFRDRGNRLVLKESFVDYCESKADYFAYHFCVPTFMLQNLNEVSV